MVIALAGRRIDEPNTSSPRFPLKNVPVVEKRIKELFESVRPAILVCSAACGADLIALKVAGELGIIRRIVLPFKITEFLEKSVMDRPGNWKALFDDVLNNLKPEEEIIILNYSVNDSQAYKKTNIEILNKSEASYKEFKSYKKLKTNSIKKNKLVLVIWEGYPKDSNDSTKHFLDEALSRGFDTEELSTMT